MANHHPYVHNGRKTTNKDPLRDFCEYVDMEFDSQSSSQRMVNEEQVKFLLEKLEQLKKSDISEENRSSFIQHLLKYLEIALLNPGSSSDFRKDKVFMRKAVSAVKVFFEGDRTFAGEFLTEACQPFFNWLISKEFSTTATEEMFFIFNDAATLASKDVRNRLSRENPIYMYQLIDNLNTLGQVTLQTQVMEALLRIYGTVITSHEVKKYEFWPHLNQHVQDFLNEKLSSIRTEHFEHDVREWLNLLNKDKSCKPFMEGVRFWLDFNLQDRRLTFNVANCGDAVNEWNCITITFNQVAKVGIERTTPGVTDLWMVLTKPCVSDDVNQQKLWNKFGRNIRFIINNKHKAELTKLPIMLNNMFKDTFQKSNPRVTTTLKSKYMPLKGYRRSRSRSSSSGRSDSSAHSIISQLGQNSSLKYLSAADDMPKNYTVGVDEELQSHFSQGSRSHGTVGSQMSSETEKQRQPVQVITIADSEDSDGVITTGSYQLDANGLKKERKSLRQRNSARRRRAKVSGSNATDDSFNESILIESSDDEKTLIVKSSELFTSGQFIPKTEGGYQSDGTIKQESPELDPKHKEMVTRTQQVLDVIKLIDGQEIPQTQTQSNRCQSDMSKQVSDCGAHSSCSSGHSSLSQQSMVVRVGQAFTPSQKIVDKNSVKEMITKNPVKEQAMNTQELLDVLESQEAVNDKADICEKQQKVEELEKKQRTMDEQQHDVGNKQDNVKLQDDEDKENYNSTNTKQDKRENPSPKPKHKRKARTPKRKAAIDNKEHKTVKEISQKEHEEDITHKKHQNTAAEIHKNTDQEAVRSEQESDEDIRPLGIRKSANDKVLNSDTEVQDVNAIVTKKIQEPLIQIGDYVGGEEADNRSLSSSPVCSPVIMTEIVQVHHASENDTKKNQVDDIEFHVEKFDPFEEKLVTPRKITVNESSAVTEGKQDVNATATTKIQEPLIKIGDYVGEEEADNRSLSSSPVCSPVIMTEIVQVHHALDNDTEKNQVDDIEFHVEEFDPFEEKLVTPRKITANESSAVDKGKPKSSKRKKKLFDPTDYSYLDTLADLPSSLEEKPTQVAKKPSKSRKNQNETKKPESKSLNTTVKTKKLRYSKKNIRDDSSRTFHDLDSLYESFEKKIHAGDHSAEDLRMRCKPVEKSPETPPFVLQQPDLQLQNIENMNNMVSEKEERVKILQNIVIQKGKKRSQRSPDRDCQPAKKTKINVDVPVEMEPQVDKAKVDEPKADDDLETYLEQVSHVVCAVIGWAGKYPTQPKLFKKKLNSVHSYVFKN